MGVKGVVGKSVAANFGVGKLLRETKTKGAL